MQHSPGTMHGVIATLTADDDDGARHCGIGPELFAGRRTVATGAPT